MTSRFLDQRRSVGPPVGNDHFFWTKGGQLNPPVGNGHVFWTKGGQLDPPVSDVTFFGPKEISWTGGTVPWRFLDQRMSVFWLVSMVFQGSFMVFHGFWLVSMVFKGGFMVFYVFWLVSMVFQGGFMVFHGFGWFPEFFFKMYPPNCILAQRSSLGPPPGGRHRT